MNHSFNIIFFKAFISSFLPHFKKNILKQYSIIEFTILLNVFILIVTIPIYYKNESIRTTISKVRKSNPTDKIILFIYASLITLGIYLGSYIISKEQVTIYQPLQSGLNILFILLYGYLFFKKDNDINIKKIMGSLLIIFGIYFIYK